MRLGQVVNQILRARIEARKSHGGRPKNKDDLE